MWVLPGSHKKTLRKHRTASKNSHVLTTDELDEIQNGLAHPVPLEKGDAVFWTGRTLHYANGNFTEIVDSSWRGELSSRIYFSIGQFLYIHRWTQYHTKDHSTTVKSWYGILLLPWDGLCYGRTTTMIFGLKHGMVWFSYHGFRVTMDHMVPSYHD